MNLEASPLSNALSTQARLVVRQKKNWGEILTGFEAQSRYDVCDERGQVVGQVGESTSGFLATVGRWIMKGRRPFSLEIVSGAARVLRLERPWFWFWSTLQVTDGQGRTVGTIEQRFGLRRRFEVLDGAGRTLGWIIGPLLKPWTFVVHEGSDDGPEIGRVEKKWSGLMKEMFTDADNFLVTLPHGSPLRELVLASALLIDFCYFENEEGSGGGVIKYLE
jgi:uncharacterized protein YxjI